MHVIDVSKFIRMVLRKNMTNYTRSPVFSMTNYTRFFGAEKCLQRAVFSWGLVGNW